MQELPLFPLHTVLFRGGQLSLQIFEPRYLRMVAEVLRDSAKFGVICIRQGPEVLAGDGEEPQLAGVGTLASITDFDRLDNGMMGITVVGRGRFRLVSQRSAEDGLILGLVMPVAEPARRATPEHLRPLADLAQRSCEIPELSALRPNLDVADADQLGCFLAEILPFSLADKQQILEMENEVSRLESILASLSAMALPTA